MVGGIYLLYLIAGLVLSFSVRREETKDHFFISKLPYWMTQSVPERWAFLTFVSYLTVMVFCIIIISNSTKVKEFGLVALVKLNAFQYIFLDLVFMLFAYASVYDFAYYGLENRCVPYLSILCVNFANNANLFAWGSAVVYLLRITTRVVPKENAWIEFCGQQIQPIEGGRIYMLPALPYPYILYMISMRLFEVDIGLWAAYSEPDGRNNAIKVLNR